MSDQAERVWEQLQALAERVLEHPKDLEPRELIRRYGSLWRLWHLPAFGRPINDTKPLFIAPKAPPQRSPCPPVFDFSLSVLRGSAVDHPDFSLADAVAGSCRAMRTL